jgi:hypothetical protein
VKTVSARTSRLPSESSRGCPLPEGSGTWVRCASIGGMGLPETRYAWSEGFALAYQVIGAVVEKTDVDRA